MAVIFVAPQLVLIGSRHMMVNQFLSSIWTRPMELKRLKRFQWRSSNLGPSVISQISISKRFVIMECMQEEYRICVRKYLISGERRIPWSVQNVNRIMNTGENSVLKRANWPSKWLSFIHHSTICKGWLIISPVSKQRKMKKKRKKHSPGKWHTLIMFVLFVIKMKKFRTLL